MKFFPEARPSQWPVPSVPQTGMSEDALALLAAIGRTGYSSLGSFVHTGTGSGAWEASPSPAGPLPDLLARGLVAVEELAWFGERKIRIVKLTPQGKDCLRRHDWPVVRSEIETLQDRCGHSLKPHYGQTLLFAALARRLGYATTLCVLVPARNAIADVRLERQGRSIWVSIESGMARSEHPHDRWHRLAQAQAYLPLVAPASDLENTAMAQAQACVYLIRSANLQELMARISRGATTLWTQRYSRFEHCHLHDVPRPGRPDTRMWAQCNGYMRAHLIHRRQARNGTSH